MLILSMSIYQDGGGGVGVGRIFECKHLIASIIQYRGEMPRRFETSDVRVDNQRMHGIKP